MNMKILWLPSFGAMSVECMLQPLRLAGQLSSRCASVCTSSERAVPCCHLPCHCQSLLVVQGSVCLRDPVAHQRILVGV